MFLTISYTLLILCIAAANVIVGAFQVPVQAPVTLFQSPKLTKNNYSYNKNWNPNNSQLSTSISGQKLCVRKQQTLCMTMDENDNETVMKNEEQTTEDDNKSLNNNSSSNGKMTALIMAPPLLVKFVILLVVKFVTDLIVFPLLWTYRLAKRVKKVVFGRKASVEDDDKEETKEVVGAEVS